MMRLFSALILVSFFPTSAFATWSVIAVDRSTGRVVIASATCVDRDDQFLMGVQAVVVPGKGVAACQAGVDGTHKNQMLVFEELQKGTDPARIIELLAADPEYSAAYFHGGQTLEKLGKLDEARELYKAGVEVTSRKGDLHTRDEIRAALDLLG